MAELSYQEELRYNRQIILKAVDFDGQEKLKDSKMLIVGLGGLGCAAAQYLTAAGVGHLTLLDFDTVSLSNLQRQVLHCDARLEMPKVESAKIALLQLNPHVKIDTINAKLDEEKLAEILPHFDIIRMEGQVSVFTYEPGTPSYRDLSRLFGQNLLSCVEAGVLAPIVGIVGAIQALEALKVQLKIGKNLCGRLLMIDGFSMNVREIKLPRISA